MGFQPAAGDDNQINASDIEPVMRDAAARAL
jgi:hypothetical protein